MGTSEGARSRYLREGAADFRRMISDLKERGWSERGIATNRGLNPKTITNILIILERFGDHAFLVEPETYATVQDLHTRIMATDGPEVAQEIERQRIRKAHARMIRERRRPHGTIAR